MSFPRVTTLLLMFLFSLRGFSQPDPPLDSVHRLFVNGAADAAVRALQTSINAKPSGADEHNLLCRVYYAEERWDAAISECERAVALNPRSSLFQLWLGRSYGEKADHSSWFTAIGLAKKTHTCFEKAAELDPNNLEARSDLSEYHIEAPGFLGGGADKAAADANLVEKIDPATAFFIRARIAEHDKRNSDAEQQYKKALDLNPNSPQRLMDLASFYRRANRLDDLEAMVQKSAEANKQNDAALVDAAGLLLRVDRNLPLAANLLHRYIDQGKKSEEAPLFQAQYLLGQILEKQGNTQAAKQAYQSAVSNAADFAPAGAALKRLGG